MIYFLTKKDSCTLHGPFKSILTTCTENLNSQSQLMENFGFEWSQFSQNYSPPHGYQYLYDSFQYRDADALQGFSYKGQFNTYDGSGYVFALRGSLDFLKGNLSLLRQMNWIDAQTRAIFVEFSAYNPNINLVIVSTILIEFLESGSILTSANFQPLNLFGEVGTDALFKLILLAIFMTFIVYFMIIQIRDIIHQNLKEYLYDFWTYIEWSIIVTAWIAFVMFMQRLTTANEVLSFFKNTQGYAYIKLQKVKSYNEQLTYSLGMCVFFASIKLLKIFRFNVNISVLGLTLKHCFIELASFSAVFFIIWFAFVQLMYLIFGSNIKGYSSLTNAMSTSFQVMIGKTSLGDISMVSSVLGPSVFSAYNIIILYFVLNIFITIIMESFDKVRYEIRRKRDEWDFFGHVMKKVFGKKSHLPSHTEYKDHLVSFTRLIDDLLNFSLRVFLNL